MTPGQREFSTAMIKGKRGEERSPARHGMAGVALLQHLAVRVGGLCIRECRDQQANREDLQLYVLEFANHEVSIFGRMPKNHLLHRTIMY